MLGLVLLPFVFWLGLAGLIICTCFTVCPLIWLLHRDSGQVIVASVCGGTMWSATVGWANSCAAACGSSHASRRLNELPMLGLAPTGCQALGGQCHEVRALLGARGHCSKIDSAKLSLNKQHSLYSCVSYTMVVEPLTIVIFCLTIWVIAARQHGTYWSLVSLPWKRLHHWRTWLTGFSSFGPWIQTDNTFLRLSSKFAHSPFPFFSSTGASAVALVRQWLRGDGIIVLD